MGRGSANRDGRFAQRDRPGPVNDRQPFDAEPSSDLVRDRREDRERHRFVAFVVERFHRPTCVARRLRFLSGGRRSRRGTGPPQEPDERSVLGNRQPVGQLAEDRGRERRLPQLEDPRAGGAVGSASRNGWNHRHLVAVRQHGCWLRVVAVTREAQRAPPGSQDRMPRDESYPGGLDVGAVREVDPDLTGTCQLALDREQSDPNDDGHDAASPVSRARPRPAGRRRPAESWP